MGKFLEETLWQELMRGQPEPDKSILPVQSSWEKPETFASIMPLRLTNHISQGYTFQELRERPDWPGGEELFSTENFNLFWWCPSQRINNG